MNVIVADISSWNFDQRILAFGYLFWAAAYVASIGRSFRDRLPSVPVAAIVLNVTWEGIFVSQCAPLHFEAFDLGVFGTVCPPNKAPGEGIMLLLVVWFLLDLLLLVQAAVFGGNLSSRASSEQGVPTLQWWTLLFLAFVGAAAIQIAFMSAFYDGNGTLDAWVSNLIMSVLFIDLVRRRPSGVGLSYSAGWFKFIGSGLFALASILPMIRGERFDWTLVILFVLVLLFDLVYVWMLGRARAAPLAQPA